MADTGRPTKFREQHIKLAYQFALLGGTDKRIAEFLEVDVSTLNRWKNDHPEFKESLQKGKAQADAIAVESLFKLATGTKVHEKKTEEDEIGNVIKVIKTEKELPPNLGALQMWLGNRHPEQFKNRETSALVEIKASDEPRTLASFYKTDDPQEASRYYQEMMKD